MSKYKSWADKIQMFRFHDSFHLGLGDIRLARGDGDDLMRDLMDADALESRIAELEALLDEYKDAEHRARKAEGEALAERDGLRKDLALAVHTICHQLDNIPKEMRRIAADRIAQFRETLARTKPEGKG